jgi:hypothetical protein
MYVAKNNVCGQLGLCDLDHLLAKTIIRLVCVAMAIRWLRLCM